jgi:multisubunit Na+/H+ antiporter MnhG subunit
MPSTNELLGILIAIIVIWFVLKLAKVAIRMIFLLIAVLLIAGVAYYFMR